MKNIEKNYDASKVSPVSASVASVSRVEYCISKAGIAAITLRLRYQ